MKTCDSNKESLRCELNVAYGRSLLNNSLQISQFKKTRSNFASWCMDPYTLVWAELDHFKSETNSFGLRFPLIILNDFPAYNTAARSSFV